MPFVLGFAFVQLCAWVLGTFVEEQSSSFSGSLVNGRSFFLPIVALPTVAAWISMEFAVWARRPKLFVAPWSTMLARWSVLGVVGVAAGLGTLGIEGAALAINAERVRDWWIMGLCPLAICGTLVAMLPRYVARTGCTGCGYDWRGLPRCPECGTAHPARREGSSPHTLTTAP